MRWSRRADPRELLVRERDEYLLALQRTQADFENYRKRIARLQEEQANRAAASLVEKLLPVLDALDLAEAHLNVSLEVSESGKALRASRAMLTDLLAKEGLERVDRPRFPSTHRCTTPSRDSRVTAARMARPWWRRCCAPATAGGARDSAPPWSACGVS